MKQAVSKKKGAHYAICFNSTAGNMIRYKSMKNKTRKAVSIAMREKAEEVLTELKNCQNWMLGLVKGLKTDSKEVEGRRCMRGSDEKLCFSEIERGSLDGLHGKNVNKQNVWDHNMEGDAVEGPVVCVGRQEVIQTSNEIKTGKAHRPTDE